MAKMIDDTSMMERCIELALRGQGKVSPNPMVGCVIVNRGKVVGEGYHREYGGPHAEVHALREAGRRARGATLYVNLEPCAHVGKTLPCTVAIIEAGISEVVVAVSDPNPLVSGKGIRELKRAGIQVRTGVMRTESVLLNEQFFTFMRTGRPFVALKLAMTLDGRIADRYGKSKWITSERSRTAVHRIRSLSDAVIVGAKTIIEDNPALTVRHVKGSQPIRVVLDGALRVTGKERVFDTRVAGTIVVTSSNAASRKKNLVKRLDDMGVLVCSGGTTTPLDPRHVLRVLANIGISSVLIEGGAETAGEFIRKKCVDRLYLFYAPVVLGEGIPGIAFRNPGGIKQKIVVRDSQWIVVGEDLCFTGRM